MSTSTERRLPLSPANLVICTVMVVVAVATAAVGHWQQAIVVAVGAVATVVMVRRARRPGASDVERVDAFEYRDERDRAIARDGLAAVGATALALTAVEYVVVLVMRPGLAPWSLGQLLALAAVWMVANRVAARRR
ncbi:hypothetical protein [Actinocatenispora rupis]|uniref:Uncharacterized protein n=1 Tax=Actinocatenispora rupis TaxID=519421 RepID=A0A8J3J5L0_9ACTN|nr:hypothetical protein [Actinocatenispora rupis]GID10554.1 hypothetical protein Aru02nite_14430 [Actinocatenispora rupis]